VAGQNSFQGCTDGLGIDRRTRVWWAGWPGFSCGSAFPTLPNVANLVGGAFSGIVTVTLCAVSGALSVPPTSSGLRSQYPTPTQEPPVACQFGNAMVSVPSRDPAPDRLTPDVVPTEYRGTPGWTTVASGEPLPGVFVELRLPKTMFVAGVVMQPEIRVRNATNAVVLVLKGCQSSPAAKTRRSRPTRGRFQRLATAHVSAASRYLPARHGQFRRRSFSCRSMRRPRFMSTPRSAWKLLKLYSPLLGRASASSPMSRCSLRRRAFRRNCTSRCMPIIGNCACGPPMRSVDCPRARCSSA
jgi:hypothetical protein